MTKPKRPYFIIISLFIVFIITNNIQTLFANTKNQHEQNPSNEQPYIPDSLYFCGEKIPLQYFDVLESLDRELIANEFWHSNTILLIKRSSRFFPIIDSILEKNNIPSDFKYLAAIESGLVNVTSPVGAKGYWQFMEKTGREFGLEINDEVDERLHIEKSTEAACKYLKNAYNKFGNWLLVAASYNMGVNGVAKSCEKQHTNSYFDLWLNTETARYVFRILSIKLILENPEKYNFDIPQSYRYKPYEYCLEFIDTTITDLATFAESHNTTYKLLKTMNPWLTTSSLKNPKQKTYEIKIPTENARYNKFGE